MVPENTSIKIGEEIDISSNGVIARKAGKSYLDEIIIEGHVDNNTPGTYDIVYKINIDGKEHKRTRTITVIDENS
ncbi:immunoglobulin-like domain-containing protein [Gemella morbillorum]|uniref:immunoglobulin-like domain-containing protein n=1 Tax=Gemella morbillorum TaxID=29391 RepID=UPI003C6D6177